MKSPLLLDSNFTVKRDRLSDQVARSLEAMILSGELAVGDALPSERDLMERYGVCRPAVREALLWLNKKGFVAVSGGERARVTEPNPWNANSSVRGRLRSPTAPNCSNGMATIGFTASRSMNSPRPRSSSPGEFSLPRVPAR